VPAVPRRAATSPQACKFAGLEQRGWTIRRREVFNGRKNNGGLIIDPKGTGNCVLTSFASHAEPPWHDGGRFADSSRSALARGRRRTFLSLANNFTLGESGASSRGRVPNHFYSQMQELGVNNP
jgi:hypothetical protein